MTLTTPRRWRRSWLLLVAPILLTTAIVGAPAQAATDPEILTEKQDLRTYYPNVKRARRGWYLEGFNYISGSPQRSVLWFDWEGRGWFKQFNWGPEDPNSRCHYDQMRWRSSRMEYHRTHNGCGEVTHETSFSPGIRLMPRRWRAGDDWSESRTTAVTHREDGVVVCRGTMDYTSEVLGWVEVDPATSTWAIHVRTTQSTLWTEGHSSTGCSAGYTTDWEENYYLMPDMPAEGTNKAYNGFKRSIGGNDNNNFNWDVWFDTWTRLPN